ncbi:hypothetical protein BJ508DRAFT_105923 [Ascobolus immersus RN42]|uniref:Post-SET domain-containing protein n=1 Tax=Ascobolus immersus RN42 TaxID=1160509 RepID=A0A3N4IJJ3_ASCIM|nr:hypothetical protein BJ508DRAFT_105923 [Ascobolus immersus RN42]
MASSANGLYSWFSGNCEQICRCGALKCRGMMGKKTETLHSLSNASLLANVPPPGLDSSTLSSAVTKKLTDINYKRRGRPSGSKIVNGKLVLREDLAKPSPSSKHIARDACDSERGEFKDESKSHAPKAPASGKAEKHIVAKDSGMSLVRKFEDTLIGDVIMENLVMGQVVPKRKRRGRPPRMDKLRNCAAGKEDVWEI